MTVTSRRKRPQCHYCAAPGPTKDHVVPLSRGGRDEAFNIVPACSNCNFDKAAKWPACGCSICSHSVLLHARLGVTQESNSASGFARASRKVKTDNGILCSCLPWMIGASGSGCGTTIHTSSPPAQRRRHD